MDTFRSGSYLCQCSTSNYIYRPYGHVLTGDLSFFKNEELKNLITKGPKFREPRKIVWSRNKEIVFQCSR